VRLKNKVAVITGGNSGIGLATAREFLANGAQVAIFGRNRQTLQQAALGLGGDVLAVQGDVRKLADLDRLVAETSERFRKIDILVANAGIAKFAPVESLWMSSSMSSATSFSRACSSRCRRRCPICETAPRSC